MSKARLVITAVMVEKRPVSEVARTYGVARSWICTLLARYRAEGEAAFEPRSRRPRTSPATPPAGATDHIRPGRVSASGTTGIRTGGRLRHIAIGRPRAGTRVLIMTRGLDITVIHAATGEILRQL